MVWQVKVINNSGAPVVAPSPDTVIGTSALIFTQFGTINLQDCGHQAGGPHYWTVSVTSGAFRQIFWYDGGGVVELTINANGSFSASGQGNDINGAIGGPAGRIVTVPASRRVYINGVTNAAWQQRVSLTFNGMGATYVWSGSGEDNRELMNLAVDTLPDPSGSIQVGVLMEYAQGPGWAGSSMSPVGIYQLYGCAMRIVVSEDGGDHDYNDSGVQIQWWELPPT